MAIDERGGMIDAAGPGACPCIFWAVRGHHPKCDGRGNHVADGDENARLTRELAELRAMLAEAYSVEITLADGYLEKNEFGISAATFKGPSSENVDGFPSVEAAWAWIKERGE